MSLHPHSPSSPDAERARPAVAQPPEPARNGEPVAETLYLAGRPSLRGFLRNVRGHAKTHLDKGALVEDWQSARARLTRLERTECGIADHPPITALGKSYEPLLIELFKDPLLRQNFNTLPTDIALVPLDHLVVYQRHIDLAHVRRLRAQFGEELDEARVFRICLPHDHPQPPVTWAQTGDEEFVFLSPSNDMRFLGTMPLHGAQLPRGVPHSTLVSLVGIAVGFGTNFLNAFYVAGRLILNNGSHRAYALREAGVTHVPCIIQHVAGSDELGVVAPDAIRHRPELYLEHPRPPMLRDYFDPELHKVVSSRARLRQVTVHFKVEEKFVPALEGPNGAL